MKIKAGVIGLGRSGWDIHCPLLQMTKEFEIYAVSDINKERLKQAADTFGTKCFPNYGEMIKDPGLDLVIVCTRSNTHSSITIDALNAGKNVVVEKPMCLNIREAEAMLAAARANQKILTVFQNRRLDPDFLEVKKIIKDGLLGDIFSIFAGIYNYQSRTDWQIKKEFGGGILNNWGAHIIDQVLQLVSSPVRNVYCEMKKIISQGDAEDYFKAILGFENKITTEIEITDCARIGLPRWYILGDKGSLSGTDREITVKTGVHGKDEELKYFPNKLKQENWIRFYKNIYESLNGSKNLMVIPESVKYLIGVLDACRESDEKQKVINFS